MIMKRQLIVVPAVVTYFLAVSCGDATEHMDPKETEVWEPVPEVISPGTGTAPPSDATVLFDGTELSAWQHVEDGRAAEWVVENSAFTVAPGTGDVQTKQGFGDVQLHIEWRTPSVIEGDLQDRGNSGVFLQTLYEVQVLDSYNSVTYPNGQAASIYKQHIPLVNASRGPGEWQVYDIIFRAPRFNDDGAVVEKARVTVLHNGVLVLNHVEIQGPTVYIGHPKYRAHADKMPLMLQDHNNPVSYRNIWIREL